MIPRATSIIVRRLPPAKPGKGTAVKYVTGIVGNARNSRYEISAMTKRMNEVTAKSSTAPTTMVATVPSNSPPWRVCLTCLTEWRR
jgi:protein MPE1